MHFRPVGAPYFFAHHRAASVTPRRQPPIGSSTRRAPYYVMHVLITSNTEERQRRGSSGQGHSQARGTRQQQMTDNCSKYDHIIAANRRSPLRRIFVASIQDTEDLYARIP